VGPRRHRHLIPVSPRHLFSLSKHLLQTPDATKINVTTR
jgi:hypothetical protein